MTAGADDFEEERAQLLEATVTALEAGLPASVPPRGSGRRLISDVLVDGLETGDLRPALRSIADGPGGELTPTRRGNLPMCSAESSALMAINFLVPFGSREGLLGNPAGGVEMECELRVSGVRSPVGPTLDALHISSAGTLALEAKTAEPWRNPPAVSLSSQYDAPASDVSPGTAFVSHALRERELVFRCLDAAQLLKHLLGIRSALKARTITEPATLVLLYWEPTHTGRFASLFDTLASEFRSFAELLDDQPVRLLAAPTCDLLNTWAKTDSAAWLRRHAEVLRQRYDPPIGQ